MNDEGTSNGAAERRRDINRRLDVEMGKVRARRQAESLERDREAFRRGSEAMNANRDRVTEAPADSWAEVVRRVNEHVTAECLKVIVALGQPTDKPAFDPQVFTLSTVWTGTEHETSLFCRACECRLDRWSEEDATSVYLHWFDKACRDHWTEKHSE